MFTTCFGIPFFVDRATLQFDLLEKCCLLFSSDMRLQHSDAVQPWTTCTIYCEPRLCSTTSHTVRPSLVRLSKAFTMNESVGARHIDILILTIRPNMVKPTIKNINVKETQCKVTYCNILFMYRNARCLNVPDVFDVCYVQSMSCNVSEWIRMYFMSCNLRSKACPESHLSK